MTAQEIPVWFVRTFAFLFGALWGSFANVVIYRWPRELSVVLPGSHCMTCNAPVRAWDNVPILAWFWLRGRCRSCGARFSIRYSVIELIFAVISTAIAERVFFGHQLTVLTPGIAVAVYLVRFAFAFTLLVAAFIDLDEMIVPWFIKWFALVPLAAAWFLPTLEPTATPLLAFAGAGIGYLGLRILFIDGFKLVAGRPGMGIGDAEILLVVGALLGPAGVLFSLCVGAIQGVLAAAVAKITGTRIGPAHADEVEDELDEEDELDASEPNDENAAVVDDDENEKVSSPHKTKVPFVPFLALAALEYLLGADALVDSYLTWIRGH